ncbi:hypothetical protein SISSUDRAFT_1066988 [Sistotremastrum suecicum HHB10207 ss-3]|uniref:FAD/NAD(P)-binding domain-containing protein n=1 Tax=Sistotremastrum suecicum HHB10207 ss-3 TaxID=1314776 RepID=A0A165XMY6_9AGAM|nr:hypothetical protein SISSUDRAFT_1066988 [Sistotremastrum suecicum HHB10207 ss-3]
MALLMQTPLAYVASLIALIVVATVYLGKWYRNKQIAETTVLNELDGLGKTRVGGNRIEGTVVIAGGSIAGLLTAKVCSNHFSRVLIVEPEAWLSTTAGTVDDTYSTKQGDGKKPNPRTRVQQYISLHNYHVLTLLGLNQMFPSFEAEARKIDPDAIVSADVKFHFNGRPMKAPLGFYKANLPKLLSVARPSYETLLRKFVRKECDNVEFVVGTVTGINLDASHQAVGHGRRVQSVNIRSKDGVETTEPVLLVVDCTGPTMAGLKWINATDKPLQIPKDVYDPKMHYTTCEFEVDPTIMEKVEFPGGYINARAFYVGLPDSRIERRTMLMFRRENHTLQISCGGWDVTDRPRSVDDIRTFLKQIKGAEPIPAYIFQILDALEDNGCDASATFHDDRCRKNILPMLHVIVNRSFWGVAPCYFVKYHEVVDKLPANLISLGDSVMRLNPVRGQGCTKAMVGAATLSGLLHQFQPVFDAHTGTRILPHDFAKKFYKSQFKRIESLWIETKADDYGWDTTVPVEGETLKEGAFLRWYVRNFVNLTTKNEYAATVLFNSSMFIAPASDVIGPKIALMVAWAGLQEYLSSYNT